MSGDRLPVNCMDVPSISEMTELSMGRKLDSTNTSARIRFWSYYLLAVLVFAAAHATGELLRAMSTTFQIVDDGVSRLPTKAEIFVLFLISPFIDGLFSGVVAVALLCLPALWFHKATSARATKQSIILAIGFGFGSGALLSIATWAIFGGWGPSLLIPCCVAGAFMTPILVLIRRQTESGHQSRNGIDSAGAIDVNGYRR